MPEDVTGMPCGLPFSLCDNAQQQLAASVSLDFKRWKQARSPLEQRWKECWEAYLCDVKGLYSEPDETAPDRSRIARPVLYEAVEAIHSQLMNALFPANERFFTVVGNSETDHQHARHIEEFLRNKLEDANFIEKYGLFLKQAIITGNSAAAAPWRIQRQARRVDEPITLFGVTVGYQKAAQTQIVYDGPAFDVIDMFDFLIDPDAVDFERAKVIHRVERRLDELQRNPAYHNTDRIQPRTVTLADDSHKQSRRRAFGLEPELSGTVGPHERISLLEAWGDFRVGDTLYENYVCVVANENTVIRFEPNPYDSGLKPFVFTSFIPVPNEIYGLSAIEKTLGLQHAINTLTNQKLDVINLSINNPFTYLINDDVFDPNHLVTRPGALIPVKSHDTLRPIQYLNNFTVAFNEIADLKQEAQEATGALKYFTGGDSSANRTATEVSALVNGGSQKFSSFVSHLENTSLEPFLRQVFENARQFVADNCCIRATSRDGQPVFRQLTPHMLKGAQCRFRIDGTRGLLLKEQELQSISAFLQILQKQPEMQSHINFPLLYRKIYRRLGFTDESDIFIDPSAPE